MMWAALRTSSLACSISRRDSAMSAWIVPCAASGLPNAVLLIVWSGRDNSLWSQQVACQTLSCSLSGQEETTHYDHSKWLAKHCPAHCLVRKRQLIMITAIMISISLLGYFWSTLVPKWFRRQQKNTKGSTRTKTPPSPPKIYKKQKNNPTANTKKVILVIGRHFNNNNKKLLSTLCTQMYSAIPHQLLLEKISWSTHFIFP